MVWWVGVSHRVTPPFPIAVHERRRSLVFLPRRYVHHLVVAHRVVNNNNNNRVHQLTLVSFVVGLACLRREDPCFTTPERMVSYDLRGSVDDEDKSLQICDDCGYVCYCTDDAKRAAAAATMEGDPDCVGRSHSAALTAARKMLRGA